MKTEYFITSQISFTDDKFANKNPLQFHCFFKTTSLNSPDSSYKKQLFAPLEILPDNLKNILFFIL